MRANERKAIVAAYKERRVTAGIYAIRCAACEDCWAGSAPDLSTIQNRLWFTLRQGSCPHPTLQAAWQKFGPDAFSFEVIEHLEEEKLAYVRDAALKEKLAHWVAILRATRI